MSKKKRASTPAKAMRTPASGRAVPKQARARKPATRKAAPMPRPAPPVAVSAAPAPQPPAREKVRDVVKVTPAKGRPMLTWVGKRPLAHVTAFPAQHVEQFSAEPPGAAAPVWADWPAAYPPGGLLFHGDNKEVLAHLLANGFRGKVNLVYIDPPFDSGADYVRKVSLRGPSGSAKLAGERYTLGEQIQYTDIWANDNYLQFMYERLLLLKELLSQSGSIWLHCDAGQGHYLKCICDEVFGRDRFRNQVIWKRSDAHSDVGQGAKHFGTVHDMLFSYSMSDTAVWNQVFTPLPESTKDGWYRNVEPESGRRFNKADITGPGGPIKGNPVYEWRGVTRAWRYSKDRMIELDAAGRLTYSASGMPYLKRYLDESRGVPLQDLWDDISMLRGIQRREGLSYPTEKPPELLERVIDVCSGAGDLVLDCFLGSGTTVAVAQSLGRRWIGCDINNGAIQTTAKRLQSIVREQAAASDATTAQPHLPGVDEPASDGTPSPAQLSFSVWRVNDYDLQIQHNEAVNLACEHIGVERTRTDSFFDGTLRKQLVKIIPFDHPLSPVDLDEVKREIEARPEDDREITLVCLGIEHAARAWLDDWNRLRKGKNAANRMHVIELRTDEKYGAFIRHEPARARVKVRRVDSRIAVTIEEFISPSIVERLRQQAGILQPRIDDWRAMVDCVMIDPAWNGHIFNVALSDIPERKADLVSGSYDLPAPPNQTTVAVKIVDMLGEEVLVTATV